jgi:hypothetical protein
VLPTDDCRLIFILIFIFIYFMQFSPINFLAIAAGTLASILLGILWYAPWVFGKAWQRHVHLSNDQIRREMIRIRFGPAVLLLFIMGIILAAFMPQGLDWEQGAFAGLAMGGGIGATTLGMHYLFARRSVNLFLIDAGYIVLAMTIFGAVIAAM